MSAPTVTTGIFEYLTAVGLGVTVIVAGILAVCRHTVKRWLDHVFSARLQDLKSSHDLEVKQLEYRLQDLLDRAAKLNEREFIALAEMWGRIREAIWHAQQMVSNYQSYPDLARMSEGHRDAFIKGSDLQDWQKDELYAAGDMDAYYRRAARLRYLVTSQGKAREASIYLAKNGIFLPESLRKEFAALEALLWDAIAEHELNEVHEVTPRLHERIDRFQQSCDGRIDQLERLIHSRVVQRPEHAREAKAG